MAATVHHRRTLTEGHLQDWVSLDGEDWLPVNRAPIGVPGEAAEIAALFNGDGNFKPIRFSRSFVFGLEEAP